MVVNPKDKIGSRKASMSCLPPRVLAELGLAMMEGGMKYGRLNFRETPIRASVYYDAALRHLFQWMEGEDIDKDSGVSHLIKCAACCVVARDAMVEGTLVDDRCTSGVEKDWMQELNDVAKDLVERYDG